MTESNIWKVEQLKGHLIKLSDEIVTIGIETNLAKVYYL